MQLSPHTCHVLCIQTALLNKQRQRNGKIADCSYTAVIQLTRSWVGLQVAPAEAQVLVYAEPQQGLALKFYTQNCYGVNLKVPIPVAARSKGWVCGRSLAGFTCSNSAAGECSWECCVLSWRGLCDRPITRPEESYRVRCVWVWSRSLDNEDALAQQGLSSHGKKLKVTAFVFLVNAFSQ
jgi:hypothetical protein